MINIISLAFIRLAQIHVSWKHEFALAFLLALSDGKPDSTFPESALASIWLWLRIFESAP
jgi:hypothetical protein